jgi:hypothetical protein
MERPWKVTISICQIHNLAVKKISLLIIVKTAFIDLIGEYVHGFTPAFSKKFLTGYTAPCH